MWLIGTLILKALGIDEYRKIDAGSLANVSSRIDEWFPQAYVYADVAINQAIQQSMDGEGNLTINLRQFYRASQYYPRFLQALDSTMRVQSAGGAGNLNAKITGNAD